RRIAWASAGLSCSRASTASAGTARSTSAAASRAGSDRIWLVSVGRSRASRRWRVLVFKAGPPRALSPDCSLRPARLLEPEPLPDGRGGAREVERVEVQARRAAREEAVAELGHGVQAERLDRGRVVAVALELEPHPARDLGAAGIGETGELGEVVDRHDPRNDGDIDSHRLRALDEMEIRIGVVEVLRDGTVRAGVDLRLERGEVLVGLARLRVVFRIRRDLDVEPVARE